MANDNTSIKSTYLNDNYLKKTLKISEEMYYKTPIFIDIFKYQLKVSRYAKKSHIIYVARRYS